MTPTHVDKIFHAIDTMDADAFVAFLTPGGTFKFGNSPPVSGRENVHALVHGFWQAIAGSQHRRLHIWNDGESVAVQGEVAEYLIHIDNTPVFAP